jgi:hypothetical protein
MFVVKVETLKLEIIMKATMHSLSGYFAEGIPNLFDLALELDQLS